MRRLYLAILILWIHLGDLAAASLYGGGAVPAAALLRPLRDASVLVVAALCLLTVRMHRSLLVPIFLYGLLACVYLPVGRAYGLPFGVLIGSFGTVLIPMLFFLAGYYCLRNRDDIARAAQLLALLGIASAAFGFWDMRHTEFWIETVRFPEYMLNVKGLLLGANPDSGLPWNFYGREELTRRAAGLLAAPLAQGTFLAVAAVIALATWQQRRPVAVAACVFMFVGIWMSGTRGAMLIGGIAAIGYAATARGLLAGSGARALLVAAVTLAIVGAAFEVALMTIEARDGSTLGHWNALLVNLRDIHRVALFGGGLGRQGAIAAQAQLADLGGGEGSLFTIAFQMGVPAALLFLWFYGSCLRLLWRAHRRHNDTFALALFWLGCGMTVALVTSENMLAVSAAGAFWLLTGGAIRCHAGAAPETAGAFAPTGPRAEVQP